MAKRILAISLRAKTYASKTAVSERNERRGTNGRKLLRIYVRRWVLPADETGRPPVHFYSTVEKYIYDCLSPFFLLVPTLEATIPRIG